MKGLKTLGGWQPLHTTIVTTFGPGWKGKEYCLNFWGEDGYTKVAACGSKEQLLELAQEIVDYFKENDHARKETEV